ncbi:serine/arginine repetitive matrix protein 1-like isoform X2 [Saccostrea cucullata]|uniref:serine/arginine repetitive matrix protein 1-like isoform X2 n=1 Tax=Saccostrea cuccullata TaxID=36930 RepID=UPI002ED3DB69
MANVDGSWRFCEGYLEHKGKQGRGYERLWCVLKDRTIHIFKDRDKRNEDTVLGSLNIDNNTEYKYGDSERDGYKFELYTLGLDRCKRANRFKSRKKVEREMWRAYIIGLSKGTVPKDLDLMESQIEEIEAKLNAFLHQEANKVAEGGSPSIGGGSGHQALQKRISMSPSEDSGIDNTSRYPKSYRSQRSSSSGSRDTISGGGGGPTMRHKFTNDPKMDDEVPSWFYPNCTRDFAEKVLVNGGRYGNTLMRESSSQKTSGSYVISKIGKMDGEVKIEHFEVERIDRGYRIKVENDHEPQKNLTGVMNTFRFIAGYNSTLPMRTNNLSDLGLTVDDANPYHLKKIERELPNTARELPEPLPDYEEPMSRPSKTFNPGILKKEKAKYERKRTPSPPEFDPPAPHRESVYYNAPESKVQKSSLQKPRAPSPTPPPAPHTPDTQAYYNENEFKDLKGKEPLHKRCMSVPDLKSTLKLFSTKIDDDINQPAFKNIPPPQSVVPCAPPPPPPAVPIPSSSATSPVQQTPVSILKSDKRSLPSLPPIPNEEPRSSVDTDTPTPAQMGLRPVKVKPKYEASSSSPSSSNSTPTPQQLGLRPVKEVQKKTDPAIKEYEDAQSVKDIRQRFEKKTPPSTAQKPTGYQPRKDNKLRSSSSFSLTHSSDHATQELRNTNSDYRHRISNNRKMPSSRHSAPVIHLEYSNLSDIETFNTSDEEEEEDSYHDAISVGISRKSSFIRKLEAQIAPPAMSRHGAPKVPEIKPMTEEEEQMYEELHE